MCSFRVLRISRSINTVMSVRTTICMVRGVRVRGMRSMSGIARIGTLTTTSATTSASTTTCITPLTLPTCITSLGTSTPAPTSVVTTRASKRTYGMVSINITTSRAYFTAAARVAVVV